MELKKYLTSNQETHVIYILKKIQSYRIIGGLQNESYLFSLISV